MQKHDRRELRSLAPERCQSIVKSLLDLEIASPENKYYPYRDAIKLLPNIDEISRKVQLMVAISYASLAEIHSDHFRDFICQIHDLLSQAHETYDSVEDVKRELNSESACLVTVLEDFALHVELFESVTVLAGLCDRLLTQEWLRLAKTPKQFNTKLNLHLGGIRTSMKELYGILNHRLQINRSRDKELWLMKKRSPILSFGQLGRQFGMSSGAALLAYRRQARREMAYLETLGQAAAVLYEWYQSETHKGLFEHSSAEGSAPSVTEVEQTSVAKS